MLTTAAILAVQRAAKAQPAPKMHRVGVISVGYPQTLVQSLRDLGYIEGQNLTVLARDPQGSPQKIDELAVELVSLRVNVIVATYPAVVFAAKRATSTIPIVMVNTPDPVQLGLVASLARPGGNITGVTSLSVDVSTKQLELLKEAVPRASRIAIWSNPDSPWHSIALKGLGDAGRSLGLQLQILKVRGPDEFANAFQAMTAARAQAVLALADPMTSAHRRPLANLALQHQLPMMGSFRQQAEAGMLMSYWADGIDLSRRAASYVDKILKGAQPRHLPIEQPTKYELVVNLTTANALGIKFPQSVLLRADSVIE